MLVAGVALRTFSGHSRPGTRALCAACLLAVAPWPDPACSSTTDPCYLVLWTAAAAAVAGDSSVQGIASPAAGPCCSSSGEGEGGDLPSPRWHSRRRTWPPAAAAVDASWWLGGGPQVSLPSLVQRGQELCALALALVVVRTVPSSRPHIFAPPACHRSPAHAAWPHQV